MVDVVNEMENATVGYLIGLSKERVRKAGTFSI